MGEEERTFYVLNIPYLFSLSPSTFFLLIIIPYLCMFEIHFQETFINSNKIIFLWGVKSREYVGIASEKLFLQECIFRSRIYFDSYKLLCNNLDVTTLYVTEPGLGFCVKLVWQIYTVKSNRAYHQGMIPNILHRFLHKK